MNRRPRYTPPSFTGISNYITPEGVERMRKELQQLWEVDRPRVTQEVSDAAALGDRSENAEYIYGKKRLREIDRRIGWLSRKLETLTVIAPKGPEERKVYFGAYVRLKSSTGTEGRYHIVGPDEIDLDAGCISIDSPLGKSLRGTEVGDTIMVKRPIGDIEYTLLEVRYTPFEEDGEKAASE
jgi:transcription elongation factor GreB